MKRKDYQKPTMRVVKLQQRAILMTSVEVEAPNAKRDDYGPAQTYTWE